MRVSLRTRVLAGTLVLVTLGLVAAGVATYTLLRKSLIQRVDQQLESSQFQLNRVLNELSVYGQSAVDPGDLPPDIPSGTYAAWLDSSGHVVVSGGHHCKYTLGQSSAGPKLPGNLPESPNTQAVFDAGPADSGPSYRVLAMGVVFGPVNQPGTFVVAIPLTDVEATLHRLLLVEAAVAGAVLLAVGVLSCWLTRVGLRPLDRMAKTAGAIAAGDLSRRVDPDDDRTEVGRLGHSLNTMLGQIESAFSRQRASEERLRRFVADASHELRTPLTSIRGYAELFRRGAAARPDDLERAMRRIEDEGARMGVLVDDLLLLARLDQGRPLDRKPVDLHAIVADAVQDARAADPDRTVELSGNGPLPVTGDDLRLRQVMANLLDNARTHTPEGAPVAVRLSRSDGLARVEVADRGPGMSSEEASRVFERFYRGDPSRSRSSGGTGLGLSIAAAIVEAHGGRIDVATSPGEGTNFTVSLPLAEPKSPDSADRAETR